MRYASGSTPGGPARNRGDGSRRAFPIYVFFLPLFFFPLAAFFFVVFLAM